MDKLRMSSRSAVDENVAKIAALFPYCITEVKGKYNTPPIKNRL